ncbi:MAG TPA: hypothetical protein VMT67_11685 [Terriglobales bacterium]|nr:hypothetical protein [Terriglobales bacterium]
MDWFRLYHEFATDPKVQSMSEAMQRRLIMLMCFRCSNTLETLQEQDICFALRIDETQLAETKALFMQKKFIGERWEILQWDKRQKPSDSSTERVRKHREAQKQLQEQACNVTETAQIREEKNREEDTKPRAPRFDAQAHLESLGVEPNVARDWLTLRSGKKLKPTETAFAGVLKEAKKVGLSMNDALILCCTRGWGGFESSWVAAQSGAKSQQFGGEKYV